jgi:hypothetical protein
MKLPKQFLNLMLKLKLPRAYKPIYLSLILLDLFFISQNIFYLKFISKNPNLEMRWGASFSAPYARSFGLDPEDTLESALKDFNFNQIRIMSYWEDIQPTSSEEFNFDDLDWQLSLIERYGRKATITLGLRQPRWPECHQSKWAEELNYSSEWEAKLNKFISTVVNRYKDRSSVVSWQLENEAKLKTFGDCDERTLNENRIQKEFELVKSLDPDRPILMSTSDQYGLPLNKPVPDVYGFSIYTKVTVPGTNLRFSYPQLPSWHGARAEAINLIKDREVVIHELQTEPWGNKPVQDLSLSEQNQTMSPNQLKYNLMYAKNIGTRQADVWGIEWWYWRQLKFSDSSILEATKEVIN